MGGIYDSNLLSELATREIEYNSILSIDSRDRNSTEQINNITIKNNIRLPNIIGIGLQSVNLPLSLNNINQYNNLIYVIIGSGPSVPIIVPIGKYYPNLITEGTSLNIIYGIPDILLSSLNTQSGSSTFGIYLDADGRFILYNTMSAFTISYCPIQTQQVTGLYPASSGSVTPINQNIATLTKAIKLNPVTGQYTRYIDICSSYLSKYNVPSQTSKNFPPNLLARIYIDRNKAMAQYSDSNFVLNPNSPDVIFEIKNINWMRYIPSQDFGVGIDVQLYDEFTNLLDLSGGAIDYTLTFLTKNL